MITKTHSIHGAPQIASRHDRSSPSLLNSTSPITIAPIAATRIIQPPCESAKSSPTQRRINFPTHPRAASSEALGAKEDPRPPTRALPKAITPIPTTKSPTAIGDAFPNNNRIEKEGTKSNAIVQIHARTGSRRFAIIQNATIVPVASSTAAYCVAQNSANGVS